MKMDLEIEYSLLRDIRDIVEGKTCALVGHAESIFDYEHGAEIDSADVVVRFHGFPLDPVKHRHIGTRTDLHYIGWLGDMRDMLGLNCADVEDIISKKMFRGKPLVGKKPALLHRIKNNWNPVDPGNCILPGKPGTWSSTGIVAAVDCLISGADQVCMYGFDFWESPDIHSKKYESHKKKLLKPETIDAITNDKIRLAVLRRAGCPLFFDPVLEQIIRRVESQVL